MHDQKESQTSEKNLHPVTSLGETHLRNVKPLHPSYSEEITKENHDIGSAQSAGGHLTRKE